jgi:Cdc6-like AAA superfamily ATPase
VKIFAHQSAAFEKLLAGARTYFSGTWNGLPIRVRFHLLIIGPTGTGKTALASILAEETKMPPHKDNVLKNDRYQVTSVEARFHRERSRKTSGFWFLTCFENSSRWTTRSPNSKRYGPVGPIRQTEKAHGCTS